MARGMVRIREAGRDQSGAIMVLALAFLIVVLALAWGLIEMSYTGSASLRAYRLERSRRYAADSALQAGIQMLKSDATLGTVDDPLCSMTYLVQENAPTGEVIRVFSTGSTLSVSCEAVAGSDSGGIDSDGGQKAREVILRVSCQYEPPIPAKGTLYCGSGSKSLVLGVARVRFDVDYGVPIDPTGTKDPAVCGPDDPNTHENLCLASKVRAVVPKIIQWSLKGG